MGDVINQHPKLIQRWAERYVDVYVKKGAEEAVKWGTAFFNRDDIPLVAREAKEILRKRGYRK